ncbi:hypothetical protein Q4E93_04595 [Flavitalea sp. BT771]|uniref:hypothetical protein n=1 Tax=Flavitalea sp. BT771 TaxID=3063329 RepID=UPI0026E29910|nr:hypothetical protein [Flavitalea sp. BT771]MDO6429847.1 hypothetical protein [Flavitalea sp. BT771]MDV6218025.1 hypothetical protein [Flavitalea sp. BT771]
MLHRKFTAPFWFMLVLGTVATCLSIYGLRMISVYAPSYAMSALSKIALFFLPAIIFIEAIMYWMVRKRNVYRRATWTHVILFAIAYFTPFIKEFLFMSYAVYAGVRDVRSFMRSVTLGQICLFWGLTVMAHIYFARTLIRIFSKQPASEDEAAQPENMLDDVLG